MLPPTPLPLLFAPNVRGRWPPAMRRSFQKSSSEPCSSLTQSRPVSQNGPALPSRLPEARCTR
jgi:hypothetical protein